MSAVMQQTDNPSSRRAHVLLPLAGSFECNSCARARGSAEVTADCGATLIVCPTPILEQWREEAAKHLHEGLL